MTIEIHVPDIGADEVEVTEILVKVGDKVAADQSLLSVEGDKASMEVPANDAGVVKEIKVKVGDKVKTGSLIMTFEGEGAAKADAAPAKEEAKADSKAESKTEAKAESKTASVQDVKVPDIGGDAVEVTEIMVKVGDTVSEDQSLLSVEGDKASMEVPAPFAGKVKEIKISVGDKVSTGSLIMLFETTGPVGAAPAEAEALKAESKAETKAETKTETAPAKTEAAPAASNDGFVENS